MFTIRSEVVRVQRTYTQFERHFRLGRARLRCIFIYVRWQLQCLIRLSYNGRIVVNSLTFFLLLILRLIQCRCTSWAIMYITVTSDNIATKKKKSRTNNRYNRGKIQFQNKKVNVVTFCFHFLKTEFKALCTNSSTSSSTKSLCVEREPKTTLFLSASTRKRPAIK